MDSLKKIVWLASYPKSGNTWFRVFLSNLLSDSNTPADINNLHATPIASSRELFDEATGLSSAELTANEIDNLRSGVYSYAAKNSNDILFQKVHDAWQLTNSGKPMFDLSVTRAAIYFIRNPLDVALSFSNHLNKTLEQTAQLMSDNSYAFNSSTSKLHIQLRQQLLSWSNHVKSWVDESSLPVLVIRYEDMMSDPFTTFSKTINFIGIHKSEQEIRRAIQFSDFKEIQKQEAEKGFKEKPVKVKTFFRKGVAGAWKDEMPENIAKQICSDHYEIMKRFGYLDEAGQPI